jgi:hypothetical protein
MKIKGADIDGWDLAFAGAGIVLLLAGIGAFAGFLTLEGTGGRLAFLAAAIAMVILGAALLNSYLVKPIRRARGTIKEPPAIDG